MLTCHVNKIFSFADRAQGHPWDLICWTDLQGSSCFNRSQSNVSTPGGNDWNFKNVQKTHAQASLSTGLRQQLLAWFQGPCSKGTSSPVWYIRGQNRSFKLGALWTNSRRSFLRSWGFNYFILRVHSVGGERPQGIWGEEARELHRATQNTFCGSRKTHFTYLTIFSLNGRKKKKPTIQEKTMCHVEGGMLGQNESVGQTHSLWQNGTPGKPPINQEVASLNLLSPSLKTRCHFPALSFCSFSGGVTLQGSVDY